MPRIRVKVMHDGTAWKVNLPEYSMIHGSWQPAALLLLDKNGPLLAAAVADVLALTPTVQVDIPDRIYDPDTGKASKAKIRALYAGNPTWDRADVTDDL